MFFIHIPLLHCNYSLLKCFFCKQCQIFVSKGVNLFTEKNSIECEYYKLNISYKLQQIL